MRYERKAINRVLRRVTRLWAPALLCVGALLGPNPAEAQPFAYVANRDSDTVSVIDTTTNIVVATVGVGRGPFFVAITPDGSRAYVTNRNFIVTPGTVSVIDTATNIVVATIQVENTPRR